MLLIKKQIAVSDSLTSSFLPDNIVIQNLKSMQMYSNLIGL